MAIAKKQEVRKILAVLPFRQKLRLLIRIVLHPIVTQTWLEFIFSEPLCFQTDTLSLYRRMQKPLRPYLNKSYSAEERLNALQEHFDFLKSIFRINQMSFSSIGGAGLTLAVFACKKQVDYEILLAETDQFDREGEFRLTLRDVGSKTQIGVIAFSLATTPEPRIDIGCLQGPQASLGMEFVRKITRDFYGIRPKNLGTSTK